MNPPSLCIQCDGSWNFTSEFWSICFSHVIVTNQTQLKCQNCGDQGGGANIPSFHLLDDVVSITISRKGRLTGEEFAYLRKRRAFLCGWEDEQWGWRKEDHKDFVSWEADKLARSWEGVTDSTLGEYILPPPMIHLTSLTE